MRMNSGGTLWLLAVLFCIPPVPGWAADYVVSSMADSGVGTLREAITFANASAEADIITFSFSGTITLSSPLPDIVLSGGALTIDGSEHQVVLDGNERWRHLFVGGGASLTVRGLTFEDGSGVAFGLGGSIDAALNSTLVVERSTFRNNSTPSYGGAILSLGSTLIVSDSTFVDNRATLQASAIGKQGGSLSVYNSTFSSNSEGSAVALTGSVLAGGAVADIANSTFVGNHASEGGAIHVGLVLNPEADPSVATLRNTLLVAAAGGDNCFVSPVGSLIDAGGNLDDGESCGFTHADSRSNADARLGPLADNGGPTFTHALLHGSQAIDAGLDCSAAPVGNLDQRGIARPQGAACDVGAYEARSYFLVVDKQGGGSGTVSGNPGDVGCGSSCNAQLVEGTDATLNAAAAQGSAFIGYGGDTACGTTNPCVVTMDSDKTITASFASVVPDSFGFTAQSNVTRDTSVTSNTVTISGIGVAVPISIVGGEYNIDGGAFTNIAGTVSAGQSVSMRLTSSSAFSTPVTATLTIGGVSAQFAVTTASEPEPSPKKSGGNFGLSLLIPLAGLAVLRRRWRGGQHDRQGPGCLGDRPAGRPQNPPCWWEQAETSMQNSLQSARECAMNQEPKIRACYLAGAVAFSICMAGCTDLQIMKGSAEVPQAPMGMGQVSLERITNDSDSESFVRVSPDGRYLIFNIATSSQSSGMLFSIMNAGKQLTGRQMQESYRQNAIAMMELGSPGRTIVSQQGAVDPAWFHDSKSFVFSMLQGQTTLFASTRIGQGTAAVRFVSPTPCGDNDRAPSVSSDGSRLLFVTTIPNAPSMLSVMDMKTSEAKCRQLFEGENPQWSPKGKQFTFTRTVSGHSHLFTYDETRNQLSQLTFGNHHNYQPAWSPDGSSLVFVSSRAGSPNLYTIETDGSNLAQITQGDTIDESPTWSRDGHIYFTSNASGQVDIWRASIAGR